MAQPDSSPFLNANQGNHRQSAKDLSGQILEATAAFYDIDIIHGLAPFREGRFLVGVAGYLRYPATLTYLTANPDSQQWQPMKPLLYLITALYRTEYLTALGTSIQHLDPHFAVRWLPLADTTDGTDGCAKHNIALRMIERLDPGWIYHLDDDNKIHPSFGKHVAEAIVKHSDRQVFFVPQVRSDWSGYIDDPHLEKGKIDTGSYIVSTEAARGIYWRLDLCPDAPDYDWIARVCARGHAPLRIEGLAYYNGAR
jgi:hypothetical protein